jgi:hypothetical protein
MPKKYSLNDWRDEPITDRQQKLIEDKGYQAPDTKGEASDLITEILRKEDPATEGQIRRLTFYGICGDFSKKEAIELIEKNKPLHDEEQYQLWKKMVCKIDDDIKPPHKTRGKGSNLIMGFLNGFVYSVRIVIGIIITILAIATISKSLLGFAMFLICAFLAFPFLSKKFKGRFVAKGLIFAGCFFVGAICFVNATTSAKSVTGKENNQSQRSSL